MQVAPEITLASVTELAKDLHIDPTNEHEVLNDLNNQKLIWRIYQAKQDPRLALLMAHMYSRSFNW